MALLYSVSVQRIWVALFSSGITHHVFCVPLNVPDYLIIHVCCFFFLEDPFLDADDFIHENLIKEINKKLKKVTMPDIIYWGYDIVNQKGKILKKYEDHYIYIEKNDSLIKEYMLKNFWICTGSALYKKSFLNSNNIYFPKG